MPSALSLKDSLEYDMAQEKKFSYNGLNQYEIIEHIAHFIFYLRQIHIFGEGNTRTTAVFLIKYLRKLGFKNINTVLFEENSWYFRNSLVRANHEDLSKAIYKTEKYLIHFLKNLLYFEDYLLKNREMHIFYNDNANEPLIDTVNSDDDTVFQLIKKNNKITANEISHHLNISLSTTKRKIKELKSRGLKERTGSDKTGKWKIIETQ
jgi:predicted transcriptional regulator